MKIEILDTDKVILYAMSAGGLIAIELASKYSERVEKLALASSVSKKWLYKNEKIYNNAKAQQT